jgi:hypothetical protein
MVVSYKEAAMFARVKKSGTHQYLQLVENRRENGKVAQRVIATLGRLDQLNENTSRDAMNKKTIFRFQRAASVVPRLFLYHARY